MTRYGIDEFLEATRQQDRGQGLFELESERILEINLNGMVWTKMGSMIAYTGDVRFTREGVLEHGIGKLLKKAVTGEGARLSKAEGSGKLYLADEGKKITILYLENDVIVVNGNDLLAFEPTLKWDIRLMKKLTGIIAGGLFNVRIEGTGMLALTTHHDPMTLMVEPGRAVVTDPNATVAWSGTLQPEFRTDISFKTFLGRGSGESIQMLFNGQGFVIVQPFEEKPIQASAGS